MDNLVLNYLSDDSTINTKSQKKMKINHDKLTSTQATTPLNTDEIIATQSVSLSITPLVDTKDYATCNFIPGETTKELAFNVPYDDLARPQQGPLNPFTRSSSSAKQIYTGFTEDHAMDEYTFNQLERTYQTFRYSLDPTTNQVVGDKQAAQKNDNKLLSDLSKSNFRKTMQLKRQGFGNPGETDYKGPWAGYDNEFTYDTQNAPTSKEIQESEETRLTSLFLKGGDAVVKEGEKSVFHGGRERVDYQGRNFLHCPDNVELGDSGNQVCYLPKKCLHTWSGHTKGVNAIKWFPTSAHLLLSCSMDMKVKIWDVHNERTCIQTYLGHTKAVRDVSFNFDGTRFVSASYDKYCKLWDTESGKCVAKYEMKGIPNVVKFFPTESNPDIFLAGCQNKKIYKFDTRSDEIIHEYDQHLGSINSITFYDENRRFVSTSADKTLRAWDFTKGNICKYVADPMMHAMPATSLSPSGTWLAAQSLDNTIYMYNAKERLRSYRKNSLKGHLVGGFACEMSFSPDEKYITSGDSSGKLFFWDVKTCKVVGKLLAHESVVMSCLWHPLETSKVVSASWDGTIKLWD